MAKKNVQSPEKTSNPLEGFMQSVGAPTGHFPLPQPSVVETGDKSPFKDKAKKKAATKPKR